MTTTAAAVTEPKALGMITGLFSKVMGRLTPEERVSLLQDATAITTTEIGKATSMLEGDDHGRIGMVEDQWDGPADDHLEIVSTGGPDSKVPSGKVGVGPNQSASGNGAERMEGRYSRTAPQGGVQAATERLGRDIAGVKSAMKSFIRICEGFGSQVEMLKAMAASVPDGAAIQAMADKAASEAVAKALSTLDKSIVKAVRPLIADAIAKAAKSESEKDGEKESTSGHETEEEDEEEDEEASQEESGSGTEIEITNELEEEGEDEAESDDDKKASKSAAKLRVMAKSRLKWAGRRIAKAEEMTEGEKPKSAARQVRMARHDVHKAMAYVDAAKVLRNVAGPSTQALVTRIAKAKKSLGPSQANNQKTWPATTETKVGKADTTAAIASNSDDLAKAIDQISKAASGMGMLKATVEEMINAVGNRQSSGGGGGNLPPVFALAKSDPTAIASVEQELATMRDTNVISWDDFDRARDALAKAKMGLPHDHVQALVNRLPQSAQQVLNRFAVAA